MAISLLDLSEDILLSIVHHLPVKYILSIRQTSRRLGNLTRYRSVWLDACNRLVIDRRLPFPYDTLDGLDAAELEKRTRRALALEDAWSPNKCSPRRMLSFVGGSLNGLQSVRFVLKQYNEWIIAISEGIWPVITCWGLQGLEGGSPIKVGQWYCRGATIKDVAVDACLTSEAAIAVAVDNYSQNKRYVEIQKIKQVSGTHEVAFQSLKALETDFSPVLLSEDTLVLSDEFSEVRIMNWRTEEYAVLKSSAESDEVIPHDKCLQVLFANHGVFVAHSRSIELFPDVALCPPQETAPIIRPLETHTFGWVAGIAMASLLCSVTDPPQSTVAVVVRSEESNPWSFDKDSINLYIFYPTGDYPATTSCPYKFPPSYRSYLPTRRDFLRCPTLTLGPNFSSIWFVSEVVRDRGRSQTLLAILWFGELSNPSDMGVPSNCYHLLRNSGEDSAIWTSIDYVENRGCIALGAIDGSVKVLLMVE